MSDTYQCDVCQDSGEYPIFDRFGTERFMIFCPACRLCLHDGPDVDRIKVAGSPPEGETGAES